MNNVRKKKRTVNQNKFSVDFDKNAIKETILETYSEIQKESRKFHTPTEFLKLPLSFIFGALEIVLILFALGFIFGPFIILRNQAVNISTIASAIILIFIGILCGIFAYICHNTRKEVDKETDKYYIVAYFSAIVSLVALIISLIGLVKVM